jgi:deoxyribose-phosphate aldolase
LLIERERYKFQIASIMQEFNYREIAGMIDHALLHPTLSNKEFISGCELANRYEVATVCVKPCDVENAVELLQDSPTKVCTVIGFPHGVNLTEIKVKETELVCEQGASEVDMVINIGRSISGDWEYIEKDIRAVGHAAHTRNAKLKVIFENDFLSSGGAGLNSAELKKKLCQICGNAGADWVKTSTGFGYALQSNGTMATLGATFEDVALMVQSCPPGVQVKAAGGVKNLSSLLEMRRIGVTRIGTSSTQPILNECRTKLGMPILSLKSESATFGY